jgi:hypothetical protein
MRAYKIRKRLRKLILSLEGAHLLNSLYKPSFFPLSSSLSFVLLGTPRVISVGVWEAREEHVCVQGLEVKNQD